MACIELRDILDVVVDHGVLEALSCVVKDLGLHSYVLKCHFTSCVDMSFIAWHIKKLLHFLVNSRQKDDVLGSIFEHLLT